MADYRPLFGTESHDTQLSLMPDLIFLKFLAFHEANPKVYETLKDLAYQWLEAGNKKLGIKMLFEVMRWTEGLRPENKDVDGFSLNNNYTAHYARLLMTNEPPLRGLFEVRYMRS
jgi:hypothetical protein